MIDNNNIDINMVYAYILILAALFVGFRLIGEQQFDDRTIGHTYQHTLRMHSINPFHTSSHTPYNPSLAFDCMYAGALILVQKAKRFY